MSLTKNPSSNVNKNNKSDASPNEENDKNSTQKTKPSSDEQGNEQKESTRSQIAQIYVKAFFAVILIVIFVCCLPIAQGHLKDFQDMLIAVSGILSGPLGFIIGYYFKSGEN